MTQSTSTEDIGRHRKAFGARVRDLRLSSGLSQEQLADAAGIHRTYLSSLERGQRNVSLDNIVALARALEVDAGQMFEGI